MGEQLGLFDARGAQPITAQTPLRIRESRRARRLTLRLLPPHTLELVVPRGAKVAEVAAFVHTHRAWIESARREIASHYPVAPASAPTRVDLVAIGRSWDVDYARESASRARCRASGQSLQVVTTAGGRRNAETALRTWLLAQAKTHLVPWLHREAERVGRRPNAVQIRLQRTRWGSCSSAGTISLNAGLLFVEPDVVRYLLIHELCHLISMSHSRRFWRAVERYEPDYRRLDRRLSDAWAAVPAWVHERANAEGAA